MQESKVNSKSETIETTLGDLIEAITQIALKASKTQEEGYRLASLALSSALSKSDKSKGQVERLLSL
ncbi:MAG: hypothetical protein K1X83_07355 [Oligoflexia bacterium]|nr:hypothetical protein [Oligoflexia bacterium]